MKITLLRVLFSLVFPTTFACAQEKFSPEIADFVKRFTGRGALGDQTPRPSPQEAQAQFAVGEELGLDVAASEPRVRQSLNIHFEERGRLWVVQYLQYPFPAGMKVVRYDE